MRRHKGLAKVALFAALVTTSAWADEVDDVLTLRAVQQPSFASASVALRHRLESLQPQVMLEAASRCPQPFQRCALSWVAVRAVEEPAPGMRSVLAVDLAWRPIAALALTAQIVPLIPKAQLERGHTLLPPPKNGMLRLDFGVTAGWRF
jgi:hypothetical protein